MSEIERAAIAFHDFLWSNIGMNEDCSSDEWPINIGGDDEAATELIRLMNELQDAIKKSPYPHKLYSPKDIP